MQTLVQEALCQLNIAIVRVGDDIAEILVVQILEDAIGTEHEDISWLYVRDMVYLSHRMIPLL